MDFFSSLQKFPQEVYSIIFHLRFTIGATFSIPGVLDPDASWDLNLVPRSDS